MVCGLSLLLSAIRRTAGPQLVLLHLMVMLQELPAATLLPQVFVCEYRAGLVPPKVIEVIASGEVPVLVNAVVSGAGRLSLLAAKRRSMGTSSTVPLVSATVAVADLLRSAPAVAVTVTIEFVGRAAGAV
jgi:hypothetical protein